jgi:hypothetical protein
MKRKLGLVKVKFVGDRKRNPLLFPNQKLSSKKPFEKYTGTQKKGWDNKHTLTFYFGYPYNLQRSLK